MQWNNILVNKKTKNKYIKMYSKLVFHKICKSKWMPGAFKFIKNNYADKKLVLLTATPHEEIIRICQKIKILNYFKIIKGYPFKKHYIINILIKKYRLNKNECLYIGNSKSDSDAARMNKIAYINFNKKKLILIKNSITINNFNYFKDYVSD